MHLKEDGTSTMTEVDRKRDSRRRAVTVTVKRLAIFASVVLNVGFLSGVLARSTPRMDGLAAARPPTGFEVLRARAPEGYTGYGPYYQTLLARGLSDDEAKVLVLASLETYARGRAVDVPPAYWQGNQESRLASASRLAAELDHARAALIEVFGRGIERDATFARVFRPLDPAFSFLSSAQQVAIQKLKLEQQVKMTSALTGPALGVVAQLQPASPGGGRSAATAAEDLAASLAAVLEPKALYEYLLRDSALANQLRRSRVDFTELEFREAFAVLSRLEESSSDPGVYASARDSLRALLGGRRFAALWAGRDPLFGALQRAAEKHALEEETVLSVYELFNDHQDSLLEVTQSAGDGERQIQSLRQARTRLEERLSGLVGADAAADIERSYAHQATRLSQQFSEP
jgi:hypothetical protein